MLCCHAVGRRPFAYRRVRQAAADFLIGLLIFFAVFALAALDSRPAHPAPAASTVARALDRAEDPFTPILPAQLRTVSETLPSRLPPARAAAELGPLPRKQEMPSARYATIGIMALLFAVMSTITLGLWRHLARAHTLPRRKRRGL